MFCVLGGGEGLIGCFRGSVLELGVICGSVGFYLLIIGGGEKQGQWRFDLVA